MVLGQDRVKSEVITGRRISVASNGTDVSSCPLLLVSSDTKTAASGDIVIVMLVKESDTRRDAETTSINLEKVAEKSPSKESGAEWNRNDGSGQSHAKKWCKWKNEQCHPNDPPET
mmetsp:Transcript_4938/g.10946  ORF Transcript_4938/g.10946 Transcript_4938/m.10946 type:complete len:116 (-) Transcript_4938:861-1208(-)|eukprot:CAMPEP_0168171038 /NCGR_PEP_ID=MMETSP0139_2-20121125/4496_1 /TAXON_ID=44445 /ORGANISM="Pseudo-nitzschia australis, Strain 10249 10 AB" /LENGTH=115 /DNA_ID=CAMNT_0008088573 /DNA_START=692 /DNA_END=1039 /DNA_ORIENTATION=+